MEHNIEEEIDDGIDVETYRGQTIPCVIGSITPYFGQYINYFRLEGERKHQAAFKSLVAEVRGFHLIDETENTLIATFDAASLPAVLRMAGPVAKNNKKATLSADVVREIRDRYVSGATQSTLASEYRCDKKTISNAINGKGPYRGVTPLIDPDVLTSIASERRQAVLQQVIPSH